MSEQHKLASNKKKRPVLVAQHCLLELFQLTPQQAETKYEWAIMIIRKIRRNEIVLFRYVPML